MLVCLLGCSADPGETPFAGHTLASQAERGGFCDAFAVMKRKCLRCHADPPANGAPFPLDSYEATQAPAPSSAHPDRTRAERMLSAVESNFMPDTALRLEPPVEALSCEERTTLLAWLRSGARPPADGDTSCRGVVPEVLACDEE